MKLARHQFKEWGGPFGYALTFLALTVQVLLPLLVGLEITYADRLGIQTTTICSAIIDGTPHSDNDQVPAHHDLQDGCPLCSALSIAQALTAPAAGIVAPLSVSTPIIFGMAVTLSRATAYLSSYRARAPPAL